MHTGPPTPRRFRAAAVFMLLPLLLGAAATGPATPAPATEPGNTAVPLPRSQSTVTTVPAPEDPVAVCEEAARAGWARGERICSDAIARIQSEPTEDRTVLAAMLNNRALIRIRQGDLPGAAADLDEADAHLPGHWAVYLNRAVLHLTAGDPESALASLSRAREINPALAAVISRNAALAYRALGQPLYAAAELQAVLSSRAQPPAGARNDLSPRPGPPTPQPLTPRDVPESGEPVPPRP